MKLKSELSKVSSACSGTILILIVATIDIGLGSVHQILGTAKDESEYFRQVLVYNTAKSFFDWIPYVLVILFASRKFKFVLPDIFLAFWCLLFSAINSIDWLTNFNWRPVWIDFIAYGLGVFFILLLRFLLYKIRRI